MPFIVGDEVIHLETQQRGVVVQVNPPMPGRQTYNVRFGEKTEPVLESKLQLDFDITDPFARLKQGIFGNHLDFSRTNTLHKLSKSNANIITSLKSSKTLFKPYQFKPLLKFMNSSNKRLLIADEVGLGKTIEAGHILKELQARGELNNALIICTKPLLYKWKHELKDKFGIDFSVYKDSNDFKSDLEEHSSRIKAIINYEKIRLEKDEDDNIIGIHQILAEKNTPFDLIICDESHRLRNAETKTFKGAKLIMESARAILFLSATPIMIKQENLYNQLHLLDPQTYNNYHLFDAQLNNNAPFVKALNQLNGNIPFTIIFDELKNSEIRSRQMIGNYEYYGSKKTIDEIYKGVPLYDRITNLLENAEDSIENRVTLQRDITDINELNTIFSRTRKRDITQDWTQAERRPIKIEVTFTEKEKEEHNKVIEEYLEMNSYEHNGSRKQFQGTALGLVQNKRQVASSIFAFLNHDDCLDGGLDEFSKYEDSKFSALLKIVQEVVIKNKKKIIVFATFVKTLKYLEIRLKSKNINSILFHGQVKNRDTVIDKFQNTSDYPILLSSEVGSEGIDLQFCDAIVNYDLPWNPMVVEQRIGRIDRFGQKSPVVHIYNLIVKGTLQEHIYNLLLERIEIFTNSIGDLEAIFDKELSKDLNVPHKNIREWLKITELELYTQNLSEEQIQNKLTSIERAIIHEKENLEVISETMNTHIVNDIFFKNEIDRIIKNSTYVTELELVRLVQIFFENEFPACRLDCIAKEKLMYKIKQPQDQTNTIVRLIREVRNSLESNDDRYVFSKFEEEIVRLQEFEVTFSHEYAFENKSTIFLNSVHPFIQTINTFYQKRNTTHNVQVFRFKMSNKDTLNFNLPHGFYVLSSYYLEFEKYQFGKTNRMGIQMPMLYSCEKKLLIENQELAWQVFNQSQTQSHATNDNYEFDDKEISEMSIQFLEKIELLRDDYLTEQRVKLDTFRQTQYDRTANYYDNRIEKAEENLRELENEIKYAYDEKEKKKLNKVKPLRISAIEKEKQTKKTKLSEIENVHIVSKVQSLQSLCLILID